MKYYLIYDDDIFIGYCDNKKILKKFLAIRKDKYIIKKIDKDEIPDDIIDSNAFERYALAYYQGYRLTEELPLFIYDFSKFEELMKDMLIHTITLMKIVERHSIFIKGKDVKLFNKILGKKAIDLMDMLSGVYHEPIFDETIDVEKFFKYAYKEKLIR